MVTTCCHTRRRIFSRRQCAEILAEELFLSDRARHTETYCYVVMPDHLHWMLALRGDRVLSSVVRRVKARTALRIHRSALAEGRIWQHGFHDRMVRSDEALHELGAYIVHNPVRAGLADRPGCYPYWDILWRRRKGRG